MRIEMIEGTTGNYEQEIEKLREKFYSADAVIVGAGSGLSTSAGLNYGGERLRKYFPDFIEEYGIDSMYSGGFAPFESKEEWWAYYARLSWVNRWMEIPRDTLQKLRLLLEKSRDYFVLTTNVDHTFQRSGFDKQKLCYTQGDFGLLQCRRPCHDDTYEAYDVVRAMVEAQGFVPNAQGLPDVPEDGKLKMAVPTELIPHCPRCGVMMDFNLFWDHRFVRDAGWHVAHHRYEAYLAQHTSGEVLYLELGVGYNSPGVIKYPFWVRTAENPDATFASVNLDSPGAPSIIWDRSIILAEDIDRVLVDIAR